MVVTNNNQSGGPQFNSRLILDSCFIIFMFSRSGSLKFVVLVEDSDSAYMVSAKILSRKNGENFSKKVSMNHFGFSPMYSYSIELKKPKRGQTKC